MENAEKLTILWTAIQVVLILYVLVAWFGAAASATAPSCKLGFPEVVFTDHHEAFAIVWHTLVAIFVSAAGTFVMKRRPRTPLGVGLFIGAIFVMVNWTLTILVLVGGQISKKKLMRENCDKEGLGTTSDVFTLLLGIVLFLLYGAFEVLLVMSKDELLSDDGLGDSSGYPSAGFASIDHQDDQLTAV